MHLEKFYLYTQNIIIYMGIKLVSIEKLFRLCHRCYAFSVS